MTKTLIDSKVKLYGLLDKHEQASFAQDGVNETEEDIVDYAQGLINQERIKAIDEKIALMTDLFKVFCYQDEELDDYINDRIAYLQDQKLKLLNSYRRNTKSTF